MSETIEINGKVVGEIIGKIYQSHRISSKHFYVKGRGYPISNSILKMLKDKNVEIIRIIEHGTKAVKIYETTLQKYLNAVLIQESNFEAQRCVPLVELEIKQTYDMEK